ncbi:MAG: hypothetical protein MUO51_12710 [Woeseiaceae bacterium]|nr:hypothetical protein [Woeseiaceae bacterium]
MSAFEYVMVLVSIVIALAIAHVLTAVAEGIHRFRGHGEPIKLDAVFLLWIGFVLVWLVSFWWWEFKFQDVVAEWSCGLYLFVISYAIVLFMLAEILVPHRMRGVTDSYAYFMEGRKWFFGVLLLMQATDVADTFLKGYDWGMRPEVIATYLATVLVAIAGIISERRSIQLGGAVIAFSSQILYLFQELGVLGSW